MHPVSVARFATIPIMSESIVITGMGVVSPIGCTVERFWDSLCAGRSGATPVDCLDTSELPRKIACQVLDSIPPYQGRIEGGSPLRRAAQLAIAAARGVSGTSATRAAPGVLLGENHHPMKRPHLRLRHLFLQIRSL